MRSCQLVPSWRKFVVSNRGKIEIRDAFVLGCLLPRVGGVVSKILWKWARAPGRRAEPNAQMRDENPRHGQGQRGHTG